MKKPFYRLSLIALSLFAVGIAFDDGFQICSSSVQTFPVIRGTVIGGTAIAADEKRESPTDVSAPAVRDHWQIILIGDQRIGYARSTEREIDRDGKRVIRTKNETRLLIKRFGQELKMQTFLETDETAQGYLLSFTQSMDNPPASSTKTVGHVEGDHLNLETTVNDTVKKSSIEWDRDVKSPAYQDRLFRSQPLKAGETRSFEMFMPEFNKVATVNIAADKFQSVNLYDGKPRKLLKVTITQSVLPTLPIRAYLDEEGEALKTEADFLGQTMATYAVSEEEALKSIAGAELDIAVNTLIRVDPPLKNPHQAKKIVYRITTAGQDPAEQLITGPTQTVNRLNDESAELTVTSLPIPAEDKPSKTDPEFVKPTRYLQSDDPRVVEHARKAAAGATRPGKIAVQMEQYVHDKLSEKNFSTALASAAEVAKSLEGDCTEHAVLLAAMLRAKNIPSRIAVGLVYVEGIQSFGGHMWTEAFLNGEWIPLDATLGRGGIGAGHIKLAESSFADDGAAPVTSFVPLLSLLGNMKIEVVKVEND